MWLYTQQHCIISIAGDPSMPNCYSLHKQLASSPQFVALHPSLYSHAGSGFTNIATQLPLFSTTGTTIPTLTPVANTSGQQQGLQLPTANPNGQQQGTQLPATAAGYTIFSPNTPPIPEKLASKIWNGEFIDMAAFLPEVLSASLSAEEPDKASKKKLKQRTVSDLSAWVECFTVYAGMVSMKQLERTQDLLAYANLIVHAGRQFRGNQWQIYDTNFRQMAAARKSANWANIDSYIWAMAFAHAQPAAHCTSCLGLDHAAEECHIRPAQPPKPKQAPKGSEICKRFNFTTCTFPNCRFRHVCLECHNDHRKVNCPLQRPKPYDTNRCDPKSTRAKQGPSRPQLQFVQKDK